MSSKNQWGRTFRPVKSSRCEPPSSAARTRRVRSRVRSDCEAAAALKEAEGAVANFEVNVQVGTPRALAGRQGSGVD